MDMKEEMMNDAIDDVMGDEEDDEERFVVNHKICSNPYQSTLLENQFINLICSNCHFQSFLLIW